MAREISYSAIAATMSENRSDIELSKFLGIAYSTIVGWSNSENYSNEKRFQIYLLEYFKRINTIALEKVMEYYDLESNNKEGDIAELLMPEKEVASFMISKVEWKRKAIGTLLKANREIFSKQMELLKLFVAANENPSDIEKLLSSENMIYAVPLSVANVDTSYLRSV